MWRGLEAVQAAGKPVTVISVAHQGNYRGLLALSERLADTGLASQHHLCAPSFSGEAREHYPTLKLHLPDYHALQAEVDAAHESLRKRGLFVTFNSFWPATGQRGVPDVGRTVTLQQVVEQTKDTLVHVRPNGKVQLAAAAWGRETVGGAEVGYLHRRDAATLLAEADRRYRNGSLGQLPREVEARHKFQLGAADEHLTNRIIDSDDDPARLAALVPIRTLANHSLLDVPVGPATLAEVPVRPSAYRAVRTASGVVVLHHRQRSHATILTAAEWEQFAASAGEGA